MLFADVDRFEQVNDALGHGVGDKVLRTVARIVDSVVRDGDVVGRIGGDELIVVLTGLRSGAEARAVVDPIANWLDRPVDAAGHDVYIRLSIGFAVSDEVTGANDAEEAAASLLRRADAAMYRVKGLRSTARASEASIDALKLNAQLHGAAARSKLRVLFQPLVDVQAGRVVCHEALVRWMHPRLGLLLPGAFLRLAEDNGTMARSTPRCSPRPLDSPRKPSGSARTQCSVNVSPRRSSWDELIRVVENFSTSGRGTPAGSHWS